MRTLENLEFINTYAGLSDAFYARVTPTPLPDPYLVSFNPAAAALLNLDPREGERPAFVEYMAGNRLLPGSEPVAMLYAGHQFGHYVPQLGDGRAILLGEVKGADGSGMEIALKGSGPTPYSRGFDGRAVLRSSIREYLCSEAMHALGVPTTRALCIIGSDKRVMREAPETTAVVARLSPSFVRFGSFEVFFYRKQPESVRQLAEHVIRRHYPHLIDAAAPIAAFLHEVAQRTARLMAHWQAIGFAHGVMNTDNMSILGLTLDYGPFGFLDTYDPGFICNHTDQGGRYAFDQQPKVALWNLYALATALHPHVSEDEMLDALNSYQPAFDTAYLALMRQKLGLETVQPEDGALVAEFLDLLRDNRLDYTRSFRQLSTFSTAAGAVNAHLRDEVIDRSAFEAWSNRYRNRLIQESSQDADRRARMNTANPKYILRNYMAEVAIRKAVQEGDYSEVNRLLALLQHPFDEQPEMETYASVPPEWARHIEVSCSS